MKSDILPAGAERDFTASVYLVRNESVLLLKHKKAGIWLQPGGHIDDNELPNETALREVEEETGYKVNLIDVTESHDYQQDSKDLPNPFKVNAHRIRESHWHCDFAFLAEIETKSEVTHSHEHEGVRWVSREEMKEGELDMPENVRKTALEALKLENNLV